MKLRELHKGKYQKIAQPVSHASEHLQHWQKILNVTEVIIILRELSLIWSPKSQIFDYFSKNDEIMIYLFARVVDRRTNEKISSDVKGEEAQGTQKAGQAFVYSYQQVLGTEYISRDDWHLQDSGNENSHEFDEFSP